MHSTIHVCNFKFANRFLLALNGQKNILNYGNFSSNITSKQLKLISNGQIRMMSNAHQTKGLNKNSIEGKSISIEQKELLSCSNANKYVNINACGKLYTKLANTKPSLFGSCPKDVGIDFKVHYYDSLDLIKSKIEESDDKLTTVCLLHGAPGHYKDYASLIKYLTNRSIRVIAPNFPDYSATLEYKFRHSTEERMDYLMEFFKTINVNKIDMLIGHSSAVYTMFELLEYSLISQMSNEYLFSIKSFGLFSTPSYDLPKNLQPTPSRLFTLKLFDYPIFRPIIVALIDSYVSIQGIQNRVDKNKIEDLLIAACAVGYSDSFKMKERLKLLNEYKIPTLLIYGTNDRLIPTSCFEQLGRDLNSNEIKLYNSEGNEIKEKFNQINSKNNLVEICRFESGGHYTFQRYSEQVNEDVYRFLIEKVVRFKLEAKL